MRALYSVRCRGRRRCRLGDGSSGTLIWATKNYDAYFGYAGRVESVLDWAKASTLAQKFRAMEKPSRQVVFPRVVARSSTTPPCPLTSRPPSCASCASGTASRPSRSEFQLCCSSRTSEALGARWSEVDIETLTWSISARTNEKAPSSSRAIERPRRRISSRTSASAQARRVHLPRCKARQALLEQTWPCCRLLRRMKRGDLTAHGFNSSFRTWAAERTNFARARLKPYFFFVGDENRAQL